MYHRRETYKVLPEKVEEFQQFFERFLLPVQVKNGGKLSWQMARGIKGD